MNQLPLLAKLVRCAVIVGAYEWTAIATSGRGFSHSQVLTSTATYRDSIRIVESSSGSEKFGRAVLRMLSTISTSLDQQFHVRGTTLTVRLFGTHRGFGLALHRSQGVWPQGGWDNAGNIVAGVLPLGPYLGNANHRLAHIYAEWLFDRLAHNKSDREPDPAWLYDGLAEVAADRLTSTEACQLHGQYPIPLRELAEPRAWWQIRGSPRATLEYCEATIKTEQMVRCAGWNAIVADLHHSTSWANFYRQTTIADTRPNAPSRRCRRKE